MAGFCGNCFSIVFPFAVADSCFVFAGDTGPEPADPAGSSGVLNGFSASGRRLSAFGGSSLPVAGGSGDEDDGEQETRM